tara:strand:+ start:243 stop:479 length:237 start_codon:yes stop_codon:yes gene_type:complete
MNLKIQNNKITKTGIPPHMVFAESKEVIFYSKQSVPFEIIKSTWMKDFPDDFKGMVIKNACLFKRLKEQHESLNRRNY